MSGRPFQRPLYLFFFALFPVLSLISANINEMALVEGLRAAVLTVTAAGALLIVLGLATGQWHRAALLISLSFLFFLSYGHLYKLFLDTTGLANSDTVYIVWGGLWLLLFLLLAAFVALRLKNPQRPAFNLNVIGLVMVLLPLSAIIANSVEARTAVSPSPELRLPNPGPATTDHPDIYYIILDGYGRADVLSAVFNFDNSPFIDSLESRGFFVAAESRANYLGTVPSLASSLNVQYLDSLAQETGPHSTNLRPLSDMVQNNQVQYFLDSLDYETITISSGYANTEARGADQYLVGSFRGLNNFETLLIQHTPIGRFVVRPGGLVPGGLQYAPHRERIHFAFDSLNRQVPTMASPKFVFAHIVAPHPPFVFGPLGEAVQPDYPYTLNDGSHFPGTAEAYIEGYRGQLSYINGLVLTAVDEILSQSQSAPIIIIQSDHGPGAYLEWNNVNDNSCLKERAANFTAILTPDSRPEFYDEITPVNIFRILFSAYFGMDLERLPDRTYFATPNLPFEFIEVTGRIDGSAACLTR